MREIKFRYYWQSEENAIKKYEYTLDELEGKEVREFHTLHDIHRELKHQDQITTETEDFHRVDIYNLKESACSHDRHVTPEIGHLISGGERAPDIGLLRSLGLLAYECCDCGKNIENLDLLNERESAKIIRFRETKNHDK